MTPPSPIASPGGDSQALVRQNHELRERLQEEASLYRRRLDTYRQAQQNQAALVGRLQSKVLQYKQKCNELEGRFNESSGPPSLLKVTHLVIRHGQNVILEHCRGLALRWIAALVIACAADELALPLVFRREGERAEADVLREGRRVPHLGVR